jgi:hypothetical protein
LNWSCSWSDEARQLEAIRGHQRPSEAIEAIEASLHLLLGVSSELGVLVQLFDDLLVERLGEETVRCLLLHHLMRGAIKRSSEIIRGPSEVLQRASEVQRKQSVGLHRWLHTWICASLGSRWKARADTSEEQGSDEGPREDSSRPVSSSA